MSEDTLPISQRAMAAPPYLAALNPEQRAAVEALDGPVLVLAGAGTGKTRVLTTRLAHLLSTGRAKPWGVLAVTFTNKAAREMRERVEALLGPGGGGLPWLGTFHSISARMLRVHAELAGLKNNFTILDTDDQVRLLKQIIEAENIDEKKWPGRQLAGLIDSWKNRALTPEKVPKNEGYHFADGAGIKLYAAYQARLKILNACDFGDLLLHMIDIFQRHPDVLESYHKKLSHLLVDEYQDTNVAQYLWLRLLAQARKNLCVVGDDDQCLVAGTMVTMADGALKPIENLRAGDLVRSSYGSGDFRPARITEAFKRERSGELVRLTTAAGRVLTSTPEHVHFAGYRLGIVPQTHFVYLMQKNGVGFRLGTSQVYTKGQQKPMVGFAQRLIQEHGDSLWVLATHANEQEARAQEYEFSLRYAIPTLPFTPRKGGSRNGLVHDAAYLKRIFETFDTAASANRLLRDLGLALEAPHHRPRSRNSSRRNVVVTLCGDRRGRTPMHRISMVGNDAEGREALESVGLSVRAAKTGSSSWRHETANADFGAALNTVGKIGAVMPVNIFRTARLGAQAEEGAESNSLPFTAAAHLRTGMALFDADGGYDIVAKVERVPYSGFVYDLNIEATHNFIANGIVTHNSIYGWRGAEVDNILRFEHDFPGAQVVRLERNYRSTGHILAAASHLIAHNRGRLGKTLFTDDDDGNRVKVRGVWDGEAEARLIGDDIEAWVTQQAFLPLAHRAQHVGVGSARPPAAQASLEAPRSHLETTTPVTARRHTYADCAVLVRAAWQMRAFEERFLMLRIPYKVIGGPRFFERAEVRDAHAYLRLIRSEDDDLAFERIVNQPKRGIGEGTVQKLHAHAGKPPVRFVTDHGPLFDAETGEVVIAQQEAPGGATRFRSLVAAARELILTDELPLKAKTALRSFLTDLDRWRERSRQISHIELAETILDESGYTEMLRNDKSPQAQTRLENLKELVQSMGQYDTLEAYLEHVALVLDIEAEADSENVQLSTLHAAKGLEWPLVFLPGWEEEVFPSKRSIDENGDKGLEEERRLAYVGITRARESARISFVANRQIYGRWQSVLPSRFIDELPPASVDAVSETGYTMQAGGVRESAARFEAYAPGAGFNSAYQSPGWRRAQENMSQNTGKRGKPPMLEGEARLIARSGDDDSSFKRGDRIFHQKFGYGKIRAVEGNKLTVDFDKAGEKRVIDSFVVPADAV